MSDGLGAKGLPDLRLGLKELVSDGPGAKGLPDLRLGLALALVLIGHGGIGDCVSCGW